MKQVEFTRHPDGWRMVEREFFGQQHMRQQPPVVVSALEFLNAVNRLRADGWEVIVNESDRFVANQPQAQPSIPGAGGGSRFPGGGA